MPILPLLIRRRQAMRRWFLLSTRQRERRKQRGEAGARAGSGPAEATARRRAGARAAAGGTLPPREACEQAAVTPWPSPVPPSQTSHGRRHAPPPSAPLPPLRQQGGAGAASERRVEATGGAEQHGSANAAKLDTATRRPWRRVDARMSAPSDALMATRGGSCSRRLRRVLIAVGFPSASQLLFLLNHRLSQRACAFLAVLPFSLSFLLLSKACAVHCCACAAPAHRRRRSRKELDDALVRSS